MIEIQIRDYPHGPYWYFVVLCRGKELASSSASYTRKRDAIRGAERLAAAMFRGVRITEKGE